MNLYDPGADFRAFNAALDITLCEEGSLVEQIAPLQSILEFAGAAYPSGWREGL